MLFSISAASSRGCRRYMEDRVVIEYLRDAEHKIKGLFVAVLDGHGGPQASSYVQQNLWETLKDEAGFFSDDDQTILKSMESAFLKIHDRMKQEVYQTWPLRANGHFSTAGTTASCSLIRNGKIYTAHCGDSRIVLVSGSKVGFTHEDVTHDHKPEDPKELKRIEGDGGSVSRITPVPRVVWIRQTGEIIEHIPFLSIARSLGDYWSHIPDTENYSVSPIPDLNVREIGPQDKYLVLVSDGITHVMRSSHVAGHLWDMHPKSKDRKIINPARYLLEKTIRGWKNMKSDNMSIITIGFHEPDSDPFASIPTYHDKEAHVDSETPLHLETHFTASPKHIVLLCNSKTRSVEPEHDTLAIMRFADEVTEVYEGPGFADEMIEEGDDDDKSPEEKSLTPEDEEINEKEVSMCLNEEEDSTETPVIDEFDAEIIRSLESAGPNSVNQPVRVLNVNMEQRQYLTVGSLNGDVEERTINDGDDASEESDGNDEEKVEESITVDLVSEEEETENIDNKRPMKRKRPPPNEVVNKSKRISS